MNFKSVNLFSTRQLKVVRDTVMKTYHELSMTENGEVAEEHLMQLGWLNDAMENWLEEQRVLSLKEMSRSRDQYRRRAANDGFRAGMVVYYLLGEKPTADVKRKVIANARYVSNYAVEALIARYGKATEDVLTDKEPRTSRTNALYDELPEVFSRDLLRQKMQNLKLRTKDRDVVWRWRKTGMIVVTDDGQFKKRLNV